MRHSNGAVQKAALGVAILASVAAVPAAALALLQQPEPGAPRVERRTCLAPDGVEIAYSVTGSGEPALVFVHGGMADRSFYDAQLAAFAGRHRVIAPDLPGHGGSGAGRQTWGIPQFGADIAAVVQAENPRHVVLFGNSMGGPAAIEAALLLPGRVLGVVGIDTFGDLGAPPAPERTHQIEAAVDALCTDFPGAIARMGMFHPDTDPALVADARRRMLRTSPRAACAMVRSIASFDEGPSAGRLTVPLRAINGDLHPTDVERVRTVKPDFAAVVMEHTGHYPMLERPDEFNRHVAAVVAELQARDGRERTASETARGAQDRAGGARFDPRLPHGRYDVGFTVVDQYDRARAFNPENRPGEHPRPVQTLVWYPAVATVPSHPMLYEQYVRLALSMARFEPITDADTRLLRQALPRPDTISGDKLREEMKVPTSATRDAVAARGTFPVLIYAPSMGATPWENAELCAYLASHGYLVAASPSFGKTSWPMTPDMDGLGAQADDIEFLVGFMKSYPGADASRIGIVGYSWGGTANVVAAQRLKAVKAVLTLDGAISARWTRYSTWTPHLDPKKMGIPFMSIAPPPRFPVEEREKRGLDRTFVFFDSLDLADAYRVTLRRMASHTGLSAAVMKLTDAFSALSDPEKEGTVRGYELLARYALVFLDAYVKGDDQSRAWLRRAPAETGVSAEEVEVQSRLR